MHESIKDFGSFTSAMASTGHYVGMYLGDPDIDFVKLAESQGVPGEKVQSGEQLQAALRRGMAATREGSPYILDVEIARYGGSAVGANSLLPMSSIVSTKRFCSSVGLKSTNPPISL